MKQKIYLFKFLSKASVAMLSDFKEFDGIGVDII